MPTREEIIAELQKRGVDTSRFTPKFPVSKRLDSSPSITGRAKMALSEALGCVQPSLSRGFVGIASRGIQAALGQVPTLRKATEEIGPALAERGVPVPIAASIGGIARGAAELLPASRTESAFLAFGGVGAKGIKMAAAKVEPIFAEKVVAPLLSGLTGVRLSAAKKMIMDAVNPITKTLRSEEALDKIVANLSEGLSLTREKIGSRIGKAVDAIDNSLQGSAVVDLESIKNIVRKRLTDRAGKESSNLNEILSILTPIEGKQPTFGAVHDMKSALQEMANYGVTDPSGQFLKKVGNKESAVIKSIANQLKTTLEGVSKKVTKTDVYTKANGKFSDLASNIDVLRSEFLKSKTPSEKLTSIFGKDSTALRNLRKVNEKLPDTLKFLDEAEKAFVTKQFEPLVRGIPQTGFIPGLIGAGGYAGLAAVAPKVAGVLAVTSPRLMGAAARYGRF